MDKYHKKIYAVILFGSKVFRPSDAGDIDILILIDNLGSPKEKFELEREISGNLFKKIKSFPMYMY